MKTETHTHTHLYFFVFQKNKNWFLSLKFADWLNLSMKFLKEDFYFEMHFLFLFLMWIIGFQFSRNLILNSNLPEIGNQIS